MTSPTLFVFAVLLFLFSIPDFNGALPQLPDAVVTDLRLQYDAEADGVGSSSSPRITTSRDPYNIGHGLKTDAEIAELRRRKHGKPLANYHQRQNDVRISLFCYHVIDRAPPHRDSRTAHHSSPKAHGGAHGGC
jgi:hypothetical protein